MTRGDVAHNFAQIFQYGLQISKRANVTPNYLHRSPEYDYEVAKKFKEASRDLELAIIHGRRQDASGVQPSVMGGIPQYLTTNVLNKAGAALTKADLQSHWQGIYTQVGAENMGKQVVCGPLMKRVVGSFYRDRRQAMTNETRVADVVDEIVTDFGIMKVRLHFFMLANEIWTLDWSNLSLRPYKGYGRWHDEKLPASGSYEKGSLTGDFTLQAKGDRAHGRIHAISTTESSYTF